MAPKLILEWLDLVDGMKGSIDEKKEEQSQA